MLPGGSFLVVPGRSPSTSGTSDKDTRLTVETDCLSRPNCSSVDFLLCSLPGLDFWFSRVSSLLRFCCLPALFYFILVCFVSSSALFACLLACFRVCAFLTSPRLCLFQSFAFFKCIEKHRREVGERGMDGGLC